MANAEKDQKALDNIIIKVDDSENRREIVLYNKETQIEQTDFMNSTSTIET